LIGASYISVKAADNGGNRYNITAISHLYVWPLLPHRLALGSFPIATVVSPSPHGLISDITVALKLEERDISTALS